MKFSHLLSSLALMAAAVILEGAGPAWAVSPGRIERPVWELESEEGFTAFRGTFTPIRIAVTLLSGAKTINHTGIATYTDSACNTTTGSSINIGSPPTFTFSASGNYRLGLAAYTNDLFGQGAQSIMVTLDADGGASGSVCIPMSCSSNSSCTVGIGEPFSLSI